MLPACISSIRRFYPDAEIHILKDCFRGDFSTKGVEHAFGAKVIALGRNFGGGGWIKLLPALRDNKLTAISYPVLILDADTVITGMLWEAANSSLGSVVVSPDGWLSREDEDYFDYISRTYVNLGELGIPETDIASLKNFPWFNSGHYLIREPFLSCEFAEQYIDWSSSPVKKRFPKLHPLTDQSVLNHYLFVNRNITVGVVDFAEWAAFKELSRAYSKGQTADLNSNKCVLHYAGTARIPYWKMPQWKVFAFSNRLAEFQMKTPGRLFITHLLHSLALIVVPHFLHSATGCWIKRLLLRMRGVR